MKKYIALSLMIFPLLCNQAGATSLDSTVQMLAKDAANGYLEPVSSAFGSNLNSGWFHGAPPAKKFKFGFEAGVVAMGTFLGDGPSHFDSRGSFRFNAAQSEKIMQPAFDNFTNSPAGAAMGPGQRQALGDPMTAALSGVDFNVGMSGATVTGDPKDSLRIFFNGANMRVRVPQGSDGAAIDQEFKFDSTAFKLPVGGILNKLPILPLAVPQLTLGSVYGTRLTLRWLPDIEISEEMGKFSYFGMGVQHNPSAWLSTKLPVDVSGAFTYQRMGIGKYFTSSAWSVGANAAKTFGWRFFSATPYAGLLFESSNLAVEYEYTVDLPDGPKTNKIGFDMPGSNWGRATAGLSLRLLVFSINADYSLGEYDSFSAGLMLAI